MLAVVFLLQWGPVAVALWYLAGQRDDPTSRAKFILMCDVILLVASHAVIMGYGRSQYVFVASRYGTVFLLGGVLVAVALGELLRPALLLAGRRRGLAVAALMLSDLVLFGGNVWRYYTYLQAMERYRESRVEMLRNVESYLADSSPSRELPDFLPAPRETLQALLENDSVVRVLPSNLRMAHRSSFIRQTARAPPAFNGSWRISSSLPLRRSSVVESRTDSSVVWRLSLIGTWRLGHRSPKWSSPARTRTETRSITCRAQFQFASRQAGIAPQSCGGTEVPPYG